MADKRRRILAAGRYLQLVAENGWEYAERTRGLEAAAIIAVTPARELILTEQYRVPLKCNVIDLPAGLVGDEGEESIISAAKRELEEETGYRAKRMKKVFSGVPSAGLSNEVINVLLADGVEKVGDGGGVEHENITVHLVPVGSVRDWLKKRERKGAMASPNVLVALAVLG
jgi:ADP-ribose pyrophosphatase